jgi:hypothetical protein
VKKHLAVLAVLLLALAVGTYAVAGGAKNRIKTDDLTGYEENPDLSTPGFGSLDLRIDDTANTLTYTLTYGGLEAPVTQAHIHFGKRALNTGISVFFCTNLGNGPAGTPACPANGGTVGPRTLTASDVIGPAAQGIEAGNMAELIAAIRAGHTYANVHTTKYPGGEIRAQLNDRGGDNH